MAIEYWRAGDIVRFRLDNVDTHEIRALLLALWGIHAEADRKDIIRELAHYHEAPDTRLPEVARAIIETYREARSA